MSKKEYLKEIEDTKINNTRVEEIEKIYDAKLNEMVKKIISLADEIDFFDEERRALSFNEIKNSEEYLGFDFVSKGYIPLVDAYDNTFVVFAFNENAWGKISASDGVLYRKKPTFVEVV